jgi:UDP-galactopyranose mutase
MDAISEAEVVIIGSGFFGLTIAERVASQLNKRVCLVERRDHIGGNAWSYRDSNTGIEVHKYGSHLFHTSSENVWSYVSKFTEFNDYRHTVYTEHKGEIFPMPINLGTINQFFRSSYGPEEAKVLVEGLAKTEGGLPPNNLEDKAISLIGRPLYEAFIRGYTAKQWQTDPKVLEPDIITRLPVRFSYDNRYFSDTYEGLPLTGYDNWIINMSSHELISVVTKTEFKEIKGEISPKQLVIYTGPIDEFFSFSEGRLGWRTLDFDIEHVDRSDFQGTSVMNFADEEVPYTRIHEFKHLHKERRDLFAQPNTIIAREFSRFAELGDEPYYPINSTQDRERLLSYRSMQKEYANYLFGGRLGTYKYLDMHMAIASALTMYDQDVKDWFKKTN